MSGLPPDPAPPLFSTAYRLCCAIEKLAAPALFIRGCIAPAVCPSLERGLRAPHRGCVVLDWRHGVGRRRRAVARPPRWGCPRRGSEHVTIVLASAPGYRTCPIPASARLPPTKAGGKERVLKGARVLIGGNQKIAFIHKGWVQRRVILKARGAHSARRGSPRVPRRQCPQASPTSRADLHK